jgi:hypothetical protein
LDRRLSGNFNCHHAPLTAAQRFFSSGQINHNGSSAGVYWIVVVGKGRSHSLRYIPLNRSLPHVSGC